MRLDKYLKVSRLIKRRTVAHDMASAGRCTVNDKVAKPGTEVKVGDTITLGFGQGKTAVRIEKIKETVRKEEAETLYTIIEVD